MIVDTPSCVLNSSHLLIDPMDPSLALSVVTDSISDSQALLENVSLINEIYFDINPIWVKCGVIFAGAISYNLYLGVNNSHSPLQDFYQEPEQYIFDPDPGTNNNDL